MTHKVFDSLRLVVCLAIGFGLGAACVFVGYLQGGVRGAIVGAAFAGAFFGGVREIQHRESNKSAIIDENERDDIFR
jgi:hypothetical protein